MKFFSILLFSLISLQSDYKRYFLTHIKVADFKQRKIFFVLSKSYTLSPLSSNIRYDTLFLVNFEGRDFLKDLSNNYKVVYSSYKAIDNDCIKGERCAFFYLPEHKIVFQRKFPFSFSSSFTIEFWIRIPKYRKKAGIIKSIYAVSGNLYGYGIYEREGRIEAMFYNFFADIKKLPRTMSLISSKKISLNKWHHIALDYDEDRHIIALYIDGELECAKELKDLFLHTVYPWNDEIVIADNFIGFLDEIRITNTSVKELIKASDFLYTPYPDIIRVIREYMQSGKIKEYQNFFEKRYIGVIKSFVYDTKYYNTVYNFSDIECEEPNGTKIMFFYRASNTPFASKTVYPRWEPLSERSKIVGRFFQWLALLYPSDDGKRTPKLIDVSVNYLLDPPPSPPKDLKATLIANKRVKLSWLPNVEKDIGGYRIYYGYSKNDIFGVIFYINGKSITYNNFFNPSTKRIEVVIDNDVIKENRLYLEEMKEKNTMYVNPAFREENQYVFFVSAYDKETQEKAILYPKNYKYKPSESALSNGVMIKFGMDVSSF